MNEINGVFEQFPYTDFHRLNMDWILQTIKELQKQVKPTPEVLVLLENLEKRLLERIRNNDDKIHYIANQFKDGQTGLVIDGGFFENDGIHKNYNGGYF